MYFFWPLKSRNSDMPAPTSWCQLFKWRLSYLRKKKNLTFSFRKWLLCAILFHHPSQPALESFWKTFSTVLALTFGSRELKFFWEFLEHIQFSPLTGFFKLGSYTNFTAPDWSRPVLKFQSDTDVAERPQIAQNSFFGLNFPKKIFWKNLVEKWTFGHIWG